MTKAVVTDLPGTSAKGSHDKGCTWEAGRPVPARMAVDDKIGPLEQMSEIHCVAVCTEESCATSHPLTAASNAIEPTVIRRRDSISRTCHRDAAASEPVISYPLSVYRKRVVHSLSAAKTRVRLEAIRSIPDRARFAAC